jgi:anti-sigma regulatory factor (Ser/Thr protein kinase)
LIELTRLHRPAEADDLDDRLGELLAAHFAAGLARLGSAFVMATSELADNAVTHGRNEVGAYVAAQRYTTTRCVLSIGDLGVGIPEHLRRAYPHLTDDGLAILEATKEGVTAAETSARAHRGIGYVHMVDEMVKTAVPRGTIRIWSGVGRLEIEVRDGRVVRRQSRTVDGSTVGSWISVELATA